MITKEALNDINKTLDTIGIEKKGKITQYVMVNERVKAFREICPDGCITSTIISQENGVVTIMATVKDETGRVLATGLAQEKESSTFINKTSHIENCETSAVGRALGFVGIGIDGSMASAEEVATAMINQNQKVTVNRISEQRIDSKKIKVLGIRCKEAGISTDKLCGLYKVESFSMITEAQFAEIAQNWEDIKKRCS